MRHITSIYVYILMTQEPHQWYIYMFVHIYIYIHIYMYACTYTHTHVLSHTHAHIHSHRGFLFPNPPSCIAFYIHHDLLRTSHIFPSLCLFMKKNIFGSAYRLLARCIYGHSPCKALAAAATAAATAAAARFHSRRRRKPACQFPRTRRDALRK